MKNVLTLALLAAAVSVGSAGAYAYEAGDWIVRVGAINVDPDDDSDNIVLPPLPGESDPLVLDGVEVDDAWAMSLIGVYMATPNFGIELLAATPFEHDIDVAGTSLAAGSTKHLPPTLSMQWYPRGGKSGWQPYIGVGVNYTIFFSEDVDKDLEDTLSALYGINKVDLDLDDSFGLAAQVGVDFPLGDRWAINAGVWYIDIDTTATIKADGARIKFDVDIDPFVYNIGIAYKF